MRPIWGTKCNKMRLNMRYSPSAAVNRGNDITQMKNDFTYFLGFYECMCAALWALSVFLLFAATLSVCSSLYLSGEPSPCMDQALWPHLAQRHACFRSHKQWCKSRQIFYRRVEILAPSSGCGFSKWALLMRLVKPVVLQLYADI